MTPLAGKVALVTGAGRGIGLSLATRLAVEGAALVVNDLDEAAARDAVESAQALGAIAVPVVGSVTDAGFPARFADAALETFGRIDILVNNAGFVWNSRLEDTTDEQWAAMLDVHLGAPFRIIREVVRRWKAAPQGGSVPRRRIVNVSSISGNHGACAQVAYASAKAGLVGMTKSLARELGPHGINVNAVAFGWIETRLTQEVRGETAIEVGGRRHRVGLTAATREEMARRVPLRRPGTTKEAAGSIVLLCGPDADYITGQVVEVDGGLAI